MSYCTAADFQSIFGFQETVELTNLERPDAIAVDAPTLQQALDNASAFIDGYLQNRVTLPITDAPKILVQCCADIARYRLDRNRVREDIRQRYEDWIFWLKDVSKGVVNLGLSSGDPAVNVTAAPDTVWHESSDLVFTDQVLSEY